MQRQRFLLLAPLALSACTSVASERGSFPDLGPVPAERDGAELARAVSPQAPVEAEPDPEERSYLSEEELSIWSDPRFLARFAESYLPVTEIEPSVTVEEREQMQRIVDLIANDRLDRAATVIRDVLTEASSAVMDFTLGNIYFQQEDYYPAAAAYESAIAKFPSFRRAWKNRGLIHIRQESWDKAIESLTRVIELGGGDAIGYGLLGVAYSGEGHHMSAESAYRMATLLDPLTVDWKMGLAQSLFSQQRFADAIALFDAMIRENPSRGDLWLLQANAYIGLQDPRHAAEAFEMAGQLGSATPASMKTLGDIYVNDGLFDLAVHSYLDSIEAQEGEVRPDKFLGPARLMTARGAHDEVLALLSGIEASVGRALKVEPRKEILKLRSRIAMARGAGDEEAAVLKEIVALDPLDGDALLMLGDHARRGGDVEQASFYYERAESLEDFEAEALKRRAQLLVGERKYAEALTLLRKAQELAPSSYVQDYLEQVARMVKNG